MNTNECTRGRVGGPGAEDSDPGGPAEIPATAVIAADRIAVSFGRVRALRGISLQLSPGETRLILGLNGAGKSTLLKALAGSVPAQRGRVLLGGRDVTRQPAHARARQGIALVPEGRGLLPGLSVRDNILLGARTAPRHRRRPDRDAIEWATEFFPRLRERLSQDCGTLSGGEMQMLATARALVGGPKVLLIDEPSLGLAPKATEIVYEALGVLQQQIALLIVEQKSVPMTTIPDTVTVLRNGMVAHEARNAMPTGDELAQIYLHGGDDEKN